MDINKIYEIDRKDYVSFIRRLNPGAGEIKHEETDEYLLTMMISKKNGKLWCARKSYKEKKLEEYYLIDYPDKDEWSEPIGIRTVVLDDPKQVQAILNGLSKGEET